MHRFLTLNPQVEILHKIPQLTCPGQLPIPALFIYIRQTVISECVCILLCIMALSDAVYEEDEAMQESDASSVQSDASKPESVIEPPPDEALVLSHLCTSASQC